MDIQTCADTPIVHLGALRNSNCYQHHSTFAIRARIISVVRDDHWNLHSGRLCALNEATPFDFAPFEITVLLQNRWQSILANLKQDTIIQINNPCVVKRFEDTIENNGITIHLELNDDPSSSTSSPKRQEQVVFALDELQTLTHIASLSQRYTAAALDFIQLFARVKPLWQNCSRKKLPSSGFGNRTESIEYVNVQQLDQTRLKWKRVNLFGVIVDCRAACRTRGNDFRTDLILVDESSISSENHNGDGIMRKIIAYDFNRDTDMGLPFRAYGDIVRIQHALVNFYYDRSSNNISPKQVMMKSFSTCLLWKHDDDSSDPIAVREGRPGNRFTFSSANPSPRGNSRDTGIHERRYNISDYDKNRVKELRKFVRERLMPRRIEVVRPFMRTVSQLFELADTGGAKKSTDVLCWVEHDVDDCENGAADIHMVVSDGADVQGGKRKMHVISKMSNDQWDCAKNIPFVNFQPCWKVRPELPCWALIKDATLECGDSEPYLSIFFGLHTSSILFQNQGAPLVRMFHEKVAESAANENVHDYGYGGGDVEDPADISAITRPQQSSPPRSAIGGTGNTTMAATGNENVAGTAARSRAELSGAQPEYRPAEIVAELWVEEQARQQQQLRLQAQQQEEREQIRVHPREPLPSRQQQQQTIRPQPPQHSQSRQKQRGQTARNVRQERLTPQKRMLSRDPEVDDDVEVEEERLENQKLRPMSSDICNTSVVSRIDSSKKHLKFVSLAQVIEDVHTGIQRVHRVKIRASRCKWPRDMSHIDKACHPICVSCKSVVVPLETETDKSRGVVSICNGCGKQFHLELANGVEWVFCMKLYVQDSGSGHMDVWVEGDEAKKFFNGIEPACLVEDEDRRVELFGRMQVVMGGGNWLDCCLQGYQYNDENEVYRVGCKMVSTRLLSRCLDGQ